MIRFSGLWLFISLPFQLRSFKAFQKDWIQQIWELSAWQLCRLQSPVYFTHETSATKAAMQAYRVSAALQSACFSTYVEVVYKQFSFHHHLLVGFFAEEGCQLLDANCCWERVPIATRHGNFVKSIVVCKEEHKHQQSLYRVNNPLVTMSVTLLNWVYYTWKALHTPLMISKIWI